MLNIKSQQNLLGLYKCKILQKASKINPEKIRKSGIVQTVLPRIVVTVCSRTLTAVTFTVVVLLGKFGVFVSSEIIVQ